MNAQGSLIVIGILLFAAVIATSIKHPLLRQKLDGVILKLPFVGEFLREAATIRFCRTASLLLSGGLPILQTLSSLAM